MIRKSTKIAIYSITGISVLCTGLLLLNSSHNKTVKFKTKEEYEAFLNNHPFSASKNFYKEESDQEAKRADRPDLAYQQDFLQTLDPALGYPPTERLAKVYEYIAQLKKNRTTTGMYQWTERGPSNVGGRTNTIMFDPIDTSGKKVWAGGTTGGLWYCNDITKSQPIWNRINDFWENIAVTSLAYDASNKQTMYAGTGDQYSSVKGGGVWKSTDAGQNWKRLASTSNNTFYYIQKIVVHPLTGDVYIATKSGLMKSMDGGVTWTNVLGYGNGTNSNAICDLTIGADNTIYVAVGDSYTQGGLYCSKTGFAGDFTLLTGTSSGFVTSGFGNLTIAIAPSDSNVVYLMAANTSNQNVLGIWRTLNKGQKWIKVNTPSDADPGIGAGMARGQAWYDLVLAVDPNNSSVLLAGGIDLFKSADGGSTWSQLSHWFGGYGFQNVHADQHCIVYKPGSSSTVMFGNDGGLFYTFTANSQFSAVFENKNQSYNVTQFYACAIHPYAGMDYFLAGAQDNGTQQFTQRGFGSTTEVYGGDGAFCFIDEYSPTYQIASYVYNSYYLSPGSWQTGTTTLLNDPNSGQFINPADYDSYESILYTAKSTADIYAVLNVTSTPQVSTIPVSIGTVASHIKVSPYRENDTAVIFIGSQSGKVIKIHGKSKTTISTGIPYGNVSCVEVGGNNNELLVTLSNYGVTSVWYTNDGGTTWQNKEGNLPDMPVRWALFNPGDRKEVMLATEVGVWSTNDISASSPTWAPNNAGLANVRTDMLKLRQSDGLVIAATHGRGLFSTGSFFTNVGLKDLKANSVAKINVYPNPASENIQLGMPVDRLELYNSLGQLVLLRNNVNEAVNIHQLPIGNYIAHVIAGNNHFSNKISINR